MSNYPPGVSGNEFPIAGPDFSEEAVHFCETCGKETEGDIEGYRGERWFYCNTCDELTDLDESDDREIDPDSFIIRTTDGNVMVVSRHVELDD